jgi:hypothetical protein
VLFHEDFGWEAEFSCNPALSKITLITVRFQPNREMRIFLFCAFSVVSRALLAQIDSTAMASRYTNETIYLSGSGYLKGNVKYRLRDIDKEFTDSTEGIVLLEGYRADKKRFVASYAVGIGLMFLSLTQREWDARGLGFAGGVVATGFSLHFGTRSQNRLQKAIWVRNRDTLTRP